MATVSITFPDAQQARVIDALCALGGWTPEMGIAKGAFAKAQVAAWVKAQVHLHERAEAQKAALASVAVPAEPDVT